MKQLYQILPFVLGVGLLGCSNSDDPTTQESADADTTPVTSNENEFVSQLPDDAPVIKVAMTGDIPPFSFQDDYGNMQGTDVDSIRAIGEEQGFKVELYKEDWENLISSVASGERDLALSGIAYSDERAQNYSLSDSYYRNLGAVMYSDETLNIKSLDDLQGLRVGVLSGTGKEATLQKMEGVELFSAPTSYLSYERLVRGEVDAVVDDLPTLQYTARNYPEYKVTIVAYQDENAKTAQQVMVMAKDNTELLKTVNEGISKLKANNTFDEIEARWLDVAETTP
jgi:ABC-type amino acid transport substrate-binding protein